jgi:FG-GAP-like repeat
MLSNRPIRGLVQTITIAVCLMFAATSPAAPGRFESPALLFFPDASAINHLATGDIDGDGDRDVYLAYGNTSSAGGAQTAVRDRVMLNQGNGTLVESVMTLDAAAPRSAKEVALIDLDRDGDLDAVTAGDSTYNGSMVVPAPSRIYRNNGGTLTLLQTLGTEQISVALTSADWDADGDIDIAIGRLNGAVDFYRNDTAIGAAVPITFTTLQRAVVSTTEIADARFARNGAGVAPLLLVLRAFPDLTSAPGVLVLRRNAITGLFGQPQLVPEPAGGGMRAMAVGDFNLDGRDDIALAVGPSVPDVLGYSLALRATGTGFGAAAEFVDSGQDFPAGDDTSVLAADFNADGRADLLFGESGDPRCTELPPGSELEAERVRYCTGTSLNLWIAGANGFTHTGQCFGNRRTVAVYAGDLDNDELPELISNQGLAPFGIGGLLSIHRSDGPLNGLSNCCVAEIAGQFASPFASLHSIGKRLRRLKKAAAKIDLIAFAEVRDVLMPDARSGPRLASRYAQFSDEIVTVMRADPTLWERAAVLLNTWSPGVRALVNSAGQSRFVDATMMDQVDQFLLGVSAVASPALAQIIAEERALLPPFDDLVGLDMNQFRDAVLPSDVLLRNGFENTSP